MLRHLLKQLLNEAMNKTFIEGNVAFQIKFSKIKIEKCTVSRICVIFRRKSYFGTVQGHIISISHEKKKSPITWKRFYCTIKRGPNCLGRMRRAKKPRVCWNKERRKVKNRRNKQESVRRFRAWNNVLIIVLCSVGYDVVVQKTTRPRKRDEQSIFPIVKISKDGTTFFDESEVSPATTSPEKRNMIYNRVVSMFTEAANMTEWGRVDVINHGVRNKGTKRETARYNAEIVVHVDGYDPFNITDDTITMIGQSAWDVLNIALCDTKRNENVLLVRKGDDVPSARYRDVELIRKEIDCSIEDLIRRTLNGSDMCVGVVQTSTTRSHGDQLMGDVHRPPDRCSQTIVQGSVCFATDDGRTSVGDCVGGDDPANVFANFTFKNESEMDGFIADGVSV